MRPIFMKKSLLFIVNPISGDTDKTEIIQKVKAKAEEENYDLHLYKTTGDRDQEKVSAFLKKQRPSRIIVTGGDGTISMIAETILDLNIPMAIIPAGSANGLAVDFDLPAQLNQQVDLAFENTILAIDVLFINDTFALHISDLGINAELIRNYEESGIRGKFGYFLQSIPTLFQSGYPYHFKIKTKDNTYETSGALLAIANAGKFGTGATINPHGKINDGLFEIIIFKNLNLFEILKTIRENPNLSPKFTEFISTDYAEISSENRIPFQIDGEFQEEIKNVSVRIEKQKLKVVVPKSFYFSNQPPISLNQ